jgi:hypothetical protein
MREALQRAPRKLTRYWAFAGTALILGPTISYVFGLLSRQPIMLGFLIVAAALTATSIAFGLWDRTSSVLLRIGVALWVLVLAWMSPVILVIVFNLNCAVQNGLAGHYECGL